MLTYTNYRSFAEVVAHYDSITPLRGSINAGKDIRPIGDRRRKYERIVKISDSCYALSDGYHFGDEHFGYWFHGQHFTPTLADMGKYAPIVWRKKRDGTAEVTLRNGWGPHQHNGRYQFLYRHTPKGMWFRNRNGKHFIQIDGTGYHPRADSTEYYLAKTRTAPEPVYRTIMDSSATHYWQKRMKDWAMLHDDNSALTFTNVQGAWILVTGGKEVPVPPRKIVDKKAKAALKPHIEEFRTWAFTMAPMLLMDDLDFVRRMRSETLDYIKEHYKPNAYGWDIETVLSNAPEMCRAILQDREHPLRVNLAYAMLHEVRGEERTREELLTMFNRKINRLCNLVKTVDG